MYDDGGSAQALVEHEERRSTLIEDRTYSLVLDLGDVIGKSCSAWVLKERCVGAAICWVQS